MYKIVDGTHFILNMDDGTTLKVLRYPGEKGRKWTFESLKASSQERRFLSRYFKATDAAILFGKLPIMRQVFSTAEK